MMSVKVDYLFNVLLRSSKFLSVLIGAVVFGTHGHGIKRKDIFWAVVLTLGVIVFSFGQQGSGSKKGSEIGYFFGILSLLCDTFVSHFQESFKAVQKKNDKNKLHFLDFTLATNIFMFLTGLCLSIISGELPKMSQFITQHPKVVPDLLE